MKSCLLWIILPILLIIFALIGVFVPIIAVKIICGIFVFIIGIILVIMGNANL